MPPKIGSYYSGPMHSAPGALGGQAVSRRVMGGPGVDHGMVGPGDGMCGDGGDLCFEPAPRSSKAVRAPQGPPMGVREGVRRPLATDHGMVAPGDGMCGDGGDLFYEPVKKTVMTSHPGSMAMRSRDARSTVGADHGMVAPGDGMCSDGGSLFYQPETKTSTGYKFVGPGQGRYDDQTTMQYVGPGGKFAKEVTANSTGSSSRQWSLGVLLVACLAAAVLFGPQLWQAEPVQGLVGGLAAQETSQEAPPAARAVVAGGPASYDCQDGFLSWQTSWQPDKKAWCCQHHQRACPEPPKDECSKPQSTWTFAMKAWCCLHSETGCHNGAAPAVAPTAPAMPMKSAPATGCDAVCTLPAATGFETASCSERVQWTAENRFVKDPHKCAAAHAYVVGECGVCSTCSLADLGCHPAPPAPAAGEPPAASRQPAGEPEHNCDAGLDSWQTGWSAMKKQWCCQHMSKGCAPPTQAVAVARPSGPGPGEEAYEKDCDKDYDDWVAKWDESKKTWCCAHADKGCPSLYDCEGPEVEKWAVGKKAWCCHFKSKGCEAAARRL